MNIYLSSIITEDHMTISLTPNGTGTPITDSVFAPFTFEIYNNGGILQHRILAPTNNQQPESSIFAGLINGATHTFVDTPTGTDATTAFAAGVKVSSIHTHLVLFDTPAQQANEMAMIASVKQTNNGSIALTADAIRHPSDVNGVARTRLTLAFYDSAAGTGVPINTTTLASGRFIRVALFGYLNP